MAEGNMPPSSAPKNERRLDPVIKSRVEVRKKGLGSRFAESFVSGEGAQTVWGHVVFGVVIPTVRDLIVNAGMEALHQTFYGNSAGPGRPRAGGYNYASGSQAYQQQNYGAYSQPRPDPRSSQERRAGGAHDPSQVVFPSRVEAQEVLQGMYDALEQYNAVTVADFYDLCDIQPEFTDRQWGWESLQGSQVRMIRGNQHVITTPKPKRLA